MDLDDSDDVGGTFALITRQDEKKKDNQWERGTSMFAHGERRSGISVNKCECKGNAWREAMSGIVFAGGSMENSMDPSFRTRTSCRTRSSSRISFRTTTIYNGPGTILVRFPIGFLADVHMCSSCAESTKTTKFHYWKLYFFRFHGVDCIFRAPRGGHTGRRREP